MSKLIDVEVRGGLGDVFIQFHETTAYDEIDAMSQDDRARVTIISHNPFADEIFKWHPKRDRIEIVKSRHFFLAPYDVPGPRIAAGVAPVAPAGHPGRQRQPIRFYPSPDDLKILETVVPKAPFLVIAPTASGMEIENRNFPPGIITTIVDLARSRRIPIIFVGRTYQGPHAPKAAPTYPPGVIDLTDLLSVPGTAEVLKRSRATVCAHSALLLLSWYERKPNFILMPPRYKHVDFDNPSPFGFGKDFPETVRMMFSEFTSQKFDIFLEKNFQENPAVSTIPHPIFESWYAPGGQGSGPGSSPAHTALWRMFLERFIQRSHVKSVVDFGCGDWQFSRLVRWGSVPYHGVDVVPSLISSLREKYTRPGVSFSCVDSEDPAIPDGDLLVTKDVLQHLQNNVVSRLIEKFRKFRLVLLVNDWHESNPNYEIHTAQWRPLDFAKPPFSIDVSLAFDFKDQWGKRAYLWIPGGK
jgi:hypothetical protein